MRKKKTEGRKEKWKEGSNKLRRKEVRKEPAAVPGRERHACTSMMMKGTGTGGAGPAASELSTWR